jgi:hypothetical protein
VSPLLVRASRYPNRFEFTIMTYLGRVSWRHLLLFWYMLRQGFSFALQPHSLVEPGTEDEAGDGIALGHFATELEAALAHDRARS